MQTSLFTNILSSFASFLGLTNFTFSPFRLKSFLGVKLLLNRTLKRIWIAACYKLIHHSFSLLNSLLIGHIAHQHKAHSSSPSNSREGEGITLRAAIQSYSPLAFNLPINTFIEQAQENQAYSSPSFPLHSPLCDAAILNNRVTLSL